MAWLGEMRPPDHPGPPPAWADYLREALETGFADPELAWMDDAARRPACYLPGQELAFEEAFVPFIETARRRVRALAGEAAGLLAPAAWLALERHLLAFLTRRAERALFLEFSIEREAARFAARVTGNPAGAAEVPGRRDRYRAFVRRLYAERGLLDFSANTASSPASSAPCCNSGWRRSPSSSPGCRRTCRPCRRSFAPGAHPAW